MITFSAPDVSHSDALASVITDVLSPTQLTMVRELVAAENPGPAAARPEQLLFWMRLNMPVAAQKIEAVLYPAD